MWNLIFKANPSTIKTFLDSNRSHRLFSQFRKYSDQNPWKKSQEVRKKSTVYYFGAVGVLCVGLSYAAVPLYRMFCQAYSYGGTVGIDENGEKVEQMKKVKDRILKIKFNADIGASMRWNFKPQQYEIKVRLKRFSIRFDFLKKSNFQFRLLPERQL